MHKTLEATLKYQTGLNIKSILNIDQGQKRFEWDVSSCNMAQLNNIQNSVLLWQDILVLVKCHFRQKGSTVFAKQIYL